MFCVLADNGGIFQRVQNDLQHQLCKRRAVRLLVELPERVIVFLLAAADQLFDWQPVEYLVPFSEEHTVPHPANSPVSVRERVNFFQIFRLLLGSLSRMETRPDETGVPV